ncbi:MAG TPA: RNA chaperone Hfq [Verrucomicrobiae bacterium]|jgi:host factor-I protein|nr:RNA chaperone Hfq [Verrucomicrobiae bacterium]
MKDSMDATAVGRAVDPEVFANRKLIRPALNRNDHARPEGERRSSDRGDRADRGADRSNGKKTPPPEQTHAENFYYQKQMQSKTPMVLVLQDGEEIHGVIEWYDKYCLKVNRIGATNLLIYKPSIKYMYKESESTPSPSPRK